MPLAIQCDSCAAINRHLVNKCDYCGTKLDNSDSWLEFKHHCTPRLKQFEETLNNYPVRELWLGVLLVIGGPIITGLALHQVTDQILWVVTGTAVSILPFFLIFGMVVVRAENRIFDREIRSKLLSFQQEHRLNHADLVNLVKEAVGEESVLYEMLPKIM